MNKFSLVLVVCISFLCCCKPTPVPRILGGEEAYEGQFPYQVSLRFNGYHVCGGSIISSIFILTAAHCFLRSKDPTFLTARVGSVDRFQGGALIRVAEIIIHEKYDIVSHDLALLRLEEPLIYSKNIQPIALTSGEVPKGANVVVSGWGLTKRNGDSPRKLQWNVLTAITRQQCKELNKWDTEALLCLAHEPDNGSCSGDSGGPAIYKGELVGICNFGHTACGSTHPDGYAKVSYHLGWIRNQTGLH